MSNSLPIDIKITRQISDLSGSNLCYHYTNLNAAKSILDSEILRLMHFSGTNDYTEGLLYLKYIKENKTISDNEFNVLVERIKHFYICSFSNNGNLLSQWRAYGTRCIGFDVDYLKNNTVLTDKTGTFIETSGFLFDDCRYFSEENKSKYDLDFNKLRSSGIDEIFALDALSKILLIKHNGFVEENEKRMYAFGWERKPFFNDLLNPYIEFPFKPNAIKSIIIGPSINIDSITDKITMYIEQNSRYAHVNVCKSLIPFREGKSHNN